MKKGIMLSALAVFSAFMMSTAVWADIVTEPPVYSFGPYSGYTDDAYGITDDGITDREYGLKEVVRVPVYCFYSPAMKDFFWTASETEMNQLLKDFNRGTSTYQYQGISGHVEKTPDEQNIPVYRFWNKITLDHFYTTSETEKKQLEDNYASGKDHYEYEGIAWYVPETSDVPVYRFFDERNYNHYYTSDEELKDGLYEAYMNGIGWYRYEGLAWYWYE